MDKWNELRKTISIPTIRDLAVFFALSAIVPLSAFAQIPEYATTTVSISVCGDGIVSDSEICDDGALNNDGAYGSSIAARRCLPDCGGYGPYCGDTVVQFLYSEECDDGNNSDGDLCSASCNNEEDPINTTDGGGGGGGETGAGGQVTGVVPIDNPTRILVSGRAYPSTQVTILKDGEQVSTANTNAEGLFTKELIGVTAGPVTFGFWANDGTGLRSTVFTTTFQVTQNAVTTVSGVYIPPTIEADTTSVLPGETITFSGTTVPNGSVVLYIDGGSEFLATTTSSGAGAWEITYDTEELEPNIFHTAKAAFSLSEDFTSEDRDTESGFGQTLNFYIGEGDGSDTFFADLNVDGLVDLTDFSILLFNWGTAGGDASPPPDINRDGVVNLTDFSIMIFYWTG